MAIRLKEPKPLKPLRRIRWKRETTPSESEFTHRKTWISKAGLFQIVEATYKQPYKYPRRYLVLWWNGTTFQPVSNGHSKRVWRERLAKLGIESCMRWHGNAMKSRRTLRASSPASSRPRQGPKPKRGKQPPAD